MSEGSLTSRLRETSFVQQNTILIFYFFCFWYGITFIKELSKSQMQDGFWINRSQENSTGSRVLMCVSAFSEGQTLLYFLNKLF